MKNESNFITFSKKHILLYLILIVIPVAIILTILVNKNNETIEFEIIINICIGTLTYIGSTALGIIVYYNSWILQHKEEKLIFEFEKLPSLNVVDKLCNFIPEEIIKNKSDLNEYYLSEDEGCAPSNNYLYLYFEITNYNTKYPMHFEILGLEINYNNQQIIDCSKTLKILTNFDLTKNLEYKTTNNLFLGIDENILKIFTQDENPNGFLNSEINIYIKVTNSMGNLKFYKYSICGENIIKISKINKRKIKKLKTLMLIY